MKLFPDPRNHCWHREDKLYEGFVHEDIEHMVCCFCAKHVTLREIPPPGHGPHLPERSRVWEEPPDERCPKRKGKGSIKK